MPKYNFTGNDGKKYQVDTPAGTTEAQARAIFIQQQSTGSLTNLPLGGSLSALTQALSGLPSALALVNKVPTAGVTSSLAKLTGVPVTNGMNTANFLKTNQVAQGIGSLDTTQVQGLIAQTAAGVNQSATTVSATTGVGKFGISPQQLEQQGYLKPGTVANYLQNPAQISSVLSSPTVWTGKDNVNGLGSLTSNVNRQTSIQQNIMQTSFQSLTQAGALPVGLPTKEVGTLLQVASKLGVNNAIAWSKDASPASLVNQANQLAKQGSFALDFVGSKLPTAATGQAVAVGYNNTVNRRSVDQAVKSILNNNKIPTPNYSTGSVEETARAALGTTFTTGFNF